MAALIHQAYLLHMPKSASVASRTRGACKTLSTGAIYAMMTMPGALLIWRHCKPMGVYALPRAVITLSLACRESLANMNSAMEQRCMRQ